MNSKSSHRSPNLFVVRDLENPKKISGVEELSLEQLELVRHYQSLSHSEGVLVGVMQGKAPWDLRPLLLNQGRIRITRFSDPSLSSQPEMERSFASLLRALEMEKNLFAQIDVGHTGEQYWMRRPYFDQTLADILEEGPLERVMQRDVLLRAIILETVHLHHAGLAHGHLAASNIAIVQQYPCIFDFGFLSATSMYSAPDSAPEIQAGAFASQAADIYGLGVISRNLVSQSFREQNGGFLDRMTLSDPHMRPHIEEVRCIFDPPASPRAVCEKREDYPLAQGSQQTVSPGIIIQDLSATSVPGAAARAASGSKPARSPILYAILAILTVVAMFQYRHYFFDKGDVQLKYQEYWSSGQPSLMRVVADAAIQDDDRFAQAVIIRSTIAGKVKVISDLFRVAFDPRWEEQLSDADRQAVLGIGMDKVIQYKMKEMPPIDTLHPGVILALISILSLESEGEQFKGILLQRMFELPDPIGIAFKNLAAGGIENMEELPARALSHIVAGDIASLSLAGYFKGCNEVSACLMRLLGLRPFGVSIRNFDATLYNRLPLIVPQLQPLLDWFSKEDIAQWSAAEPSLKLALLTGQFPNALSFEQIADLLRFPLAAIRQAAIEKLMSEYGFGVEMQPFFEVLSTPSRDQMLTRAQSISLVSSMLISGERAYSYLNQWFSTRPNPQVVLRLLMARGRITSTDPFSLEACRYLSRVEWHAMLSDLQILVQHQEALARALAYNRLRIDVPEELQVLRQMVDKEANQRNRELIKQRLQAAEVFSGE